MSMLPSQLNLGSNKPLSSGGRPLINRYRSDNSSYTGGDTIRVEIPCGRKGQFLFPTDSFLEGRLKVNCSNGATVGSCFIDANIYSIFQRMRILHGSVVLEDTLHCNRLWNVLYDVQISDTDRRQDCLTKLINDNTTTNQSHIYNSLLQGVAIQTLNANAVSADSSLIDFALVIPSALIGSLATKALPIGMLNTSSIYIEFELAPMNVAFVSESTTVVFNSYTVQDVYYNAKITQLPDDVNASLMNSLGGTVELPAFCYKSELKAMAAGTSTFNDKFSFNFSSVKNFLFWHTNQVTANGANTKRSITTRPKCFLTDYYLTINGEAYPTQSISNPSRMYLELVRAFDGLVDTSFGGIISYKNYVNDVHTTVTDITASVANYAANVQEKRWIGAIDLDRFNHSSDTLNSGTSTIGQTVNLVSNYSAGLVEAVNLYAAVMYDVIFVAENGQLSPRF